jgi:hypothetical protein
VLAHKHIFFEPNKGSAVSTPLLVVGESQLVREWATAVRARRGDGGEDLVTRDEPECILCVCVCGGGVAASNPEQFSTQC